MKHSVKYLIPRTAAEGLLTSLQTSGSNPRLDIKILGLEFQMCELISEIHISDMR